MHVFGFRDGIFVAEDESSETQQGRINEACSFHQELFTIQNLNGNKEFLKFIQDSVCSLWVLLADIEIKNESIRVTLLLKFNHWGHVS